MPRRPEPIFDDDNPEWTEADFASAASPSSLSPEILAFFPKTSVADAVDTQVSVSLPLSASVLRHFQASGPDWKERIDAALKQMIET